MFTKHPSARVAEGIVRLFNWWSLLWIGTVLVLFSTHHNTTDGTIANVDDEANSFNHSDYPTYKRLMLDEIASNTFIFAQKYIHQGNKPQWGKGCVFDNLEVKVSSRTTESTLLQGLLKTFKLLSPCFPRTHIVIEDNEASQSHWKEFITHNLPFLTSSDRALIQFFPDTLPLRLQQDITTITTSSHKHGKGFFLQSYHDFTIDRLSLLSTTDYVLVLDTDTSIVLPLTCQNLFDEHGLPYWTYWLKGANWAYPMSNIANDARVRSLYNVPENVPKFGARDDFMSVFPMIIPIKAMRQVRRALKLYYHTLSEEEAFVKLHQERLYSSFDLIGKLFALQSISSPVVSTRRCESTSTTGRSIASSLFNSHRSCDVDYFVVEHIAHPSQSAVPDIHQARHIDKGKSEYWEYFNRLYNKSACMCKAFPGLCNDETGLLLKDINCVNSSLSTVAVPEEVMFYPDKSNPLQMRENLRQRLLKFVSYTQKNRKYCSDPYPSQNDEWLKVIDMVGK